MYSRAEGRGRGSMFRLRVQFVYPLFASRLFHRVLPTVFLHSVCVRGVSLMQWWYIDDRIRLSATFNANQSRFV